LIFEYIGFDTRAKRFESLMKNMTVYEVDLRKLQEKKIDIAGKISWPSNVNFIETDFNKNKLKHDLLIKGYNPELKTIFLLEGVTYYILESAFEETLDFIKNNSKKGSKLVFDAFNWNLTVTKDKIFQFLGNFTMPPVFKKENENLIQFYSKSGVKELLLKNGFFTDDLYNSDDCFNEPLYTYNEYRLYNTDTFFIITCHH